MLPLYEYCCRYLLSEGVIKVWATSAEAAEATAMRLFNCQRHLLRVWREA